MPFTVYKCCGTRYLRHSFPSLSHCNYDNLKTGMVLRNLNYVIVVHLNLARVCNCYNFVIYKEEKCKVKSYFEALQRGSRRRNARLAALVWRQHEAGIRPEFLSTAVPFALSMQVS